VPAVEPDAVPAVSVEDAPADGLVVELSDEERGEPIASRWRRASARQSACAVPVSDAHLARSSGVASASSAPRPMVEPVDVEGAVLVDGELDELEDVDGLVVEGLVVDGLVLDGLDGLVTLGEEVEDPAPDSPPGLVLVCASTAPANVVAIATARAFIRM